MKSILKFSLIAFLLHALNSRAVLTVTNIARGSEAYHSLFLKSDGSLWAMGYNNAGQLGDGTFNNTNRPEQIVASGVTAIAVGRYYSLFLKSDGSLWGMGDNSNGQLGDGTFNNTNRPELIIASGVAAIAAGEYHSLFLKSNGSLWAMGYNHYGQLGDGTFNFNTNQPEQIVASGVTAIAAGGYFSLFLKSDHSLWSMGRSDYGQRGDGTLNTSNLPALIVPSGVAAIAAGESHSLFLKTDGSLWAMGYNYWGQLGDGTFSTSFPYGILQPEPIVASGVTAIAAGATHSLFLKSDGSLWAMGYNNYGQAGDGIYFTNSPYGTNQPEKIVSNGISAIAAGGNHSLFLKSDGSLWAMGDNEYGQLGDGFVDTNSPPGYSLPEKILPVTQPVLTNVLSSRTNLQFKASCAFGGKFYLLRTTNLTVALNQWTPLRTNAVTVRGTNNFSVTLTNAVNQGAQQFYILQSQ